MCIPLCSVRIDQRFLSNGSATWEGVDLPLNGRRESLCWCWGGRKVCLGVAGLHGQAGEGSDGRKGENKGVEVEGVPLLQGERIGNQE